MLLINGVIALIGIMIAVLVVNVKVGLALSGFPLALVVFLGLWAYLFLSDVAEDWLIAKFNKNPA